MKSTTLIVATIVLSVSALTAPSAFAESGEITRAQANPSWTRGTIEGSITWDRCPPVGQCSWAAYATVAPTKFECGEVGQFNQYVKTIPLSDPQPANGTVSIKVSNVSIVNGIVGQELCLWSVTNPELLDQPCLNSSPVCAETYRLTGRSLSGRNPCTKKKFTPFAQAAARLLTVKQYREKFCPNRKNK